MGRGPASCEITRFWNKIEPDLNSGCWIWSGTISGSHMSYGVFVTAPPRKRLSAHRYSWAMINGPIPKGLYVCHKCDTPTCVNPNHLFLGTPADNMADMVQKGRHKSPTRAARVSRAKMGHSVSPETRAKISASLIERNRRLRLSELGSSFL